MLASLPWQSIGETAADLIAPVSAANAQRIIDKGGNPDSFTYMPSRIGAGLADGALLVASPIRAGLTAVKAAKAANAAKKGFTLMPETISAMKAAKSSKPVEKVGTLIAKEAVGVADNLANVAGTNAASGIAEGKGQNHSFGSYAVTSGIGSALGASKVKKSLAAQKTLVSSVPQNIRLNERAGMVAEEAGNLGSTKNKNSVQLAKEIFSDPSKSLSEALSEREETIARLIENKPANIPSDIVVDMKFIPPKRNIRSSVSKEIDASREELLQNMLDEGYINEQGLVASKIPEIREFLGNSINWNKNQQGIARSAADEKAARELYTEINRAMDGVRTNVPEIAALRDWDRAYTKALTEADLITGIANKRAIIDAGKEYYPMKHVNPIDSRNFGIKDYLSMLAAQRVPPTIMPRTISGDQPPTPAPTIMPRTISGGNGGR